VNAADSRSQLRALYLTRFAEGFGFITLLTLLPTYINALDPRATTVLGVSISAGFIIGMYTTGFTLAQTVAVVPLAWAGDRFDKRRVLLGALGVGAGVYALFPVVDSSASFVLIRALQGLVVTGASLMTLSLVGQVAAVGTRADRIGKANAASFGASIVGSLSAGAIYDAVGFGPIFAVIAVLMILAWVVVWGGLDPDDTRVEGMPFTDLAVNRKIVSITAFRVQYAFAVTMVRTWIPIYAGTSMAAGGLAVGATAVAVTVTVEKATNMVGRTATAARCSCSPAEARTGWSRWRSRSRPRSARRSARTRPSPFSASFRARTSRSSGSPGCSASLTPSASPPAWRCSRTKEPTRGASPPASASANSSGGPAPSPARWRPAG